MQCLDTTCNVIEDGPSLSRLEAMIEHSLSEVNVSPPTGSSPRCVRMKCCCCCCCCCFCCCLLLLLLLLDSACVVVVVAAFASVAVVAAVVVAPC